MMNNMHEKYEWLKRIPLLALISMLSLAFDAGPVYAQESDGDSVADSVDLDDEGLQVLCDAGNVTACDEITARGVP